LKTNPESGQGLYRLGMSYAAQGNPAKAETTLEAALRSNPQIRSLWPAWQNIYLSRNQPDKRFQRLSSQIQKSPHRPGFMSYWGRSMSVRRIIRRPKNGLIGPSLWTRTDSRPTPFWRSCLLARILLIRPFPASEIAQINPKSAQPHVLLGMLYESQKNTEKAKFHYGEALKSIPGWRLRPITLPGICRERAETSSSRRSWHAAREKDAPIPPT